MTQFNTNSDFSIFAGISPAFLANAISRGRWRYAPHLGIIDSALKELSFGQDKRIIINLPPRHGKSELVSKYFPFWYLGNFPDKKIILASYAADFAEYWGANVRELINEWGMGLYGISLSGRATGNLALADYGGGMISMGAGGQITGRGADLIIIDDPVKNDAEAHSVTYRDKLWDWFRSTLLTRLEPGASLVLIMTRWHNDDLASRILKHDIEHRWEQIKLPAVAGENDILGRKPGDALWKERYSRESLDSIKESIGSYWFSALYQQEPETENYGIFRREYFKYFDLKRDLIDYGGIYLHPDQYKMFSVVDLAISEKETADFTVVLTFALDRYNNAYILDIIRERVSGTRHLELLISVYKKWKPLKIGIESVQFQKSLARMALDRGLPVIELIPDKDKVSRAFPIAARMESGKVFFPRNAPWLAKFEEELLLFPGGRHDDQADALAYIMYFIGQDSGYNLVSGNPKNRMRVGLT